MADLMKNIQLFYLGEAPAEEGKKGVPVANKDVVVVLKSRRLMLCSSGSEGILYPTPDTVNHNKAEDQYNIQRASTSADRSKHIAQSFPWSQHGIFFLWPHKQAGRPASWKFLKEQGLYTKPVDFSKHDTVFVPCPLDMYLDRIQNLTERISEKLDRHQTYVNRVMTCGGILDQAHTLLAAKGRGQEMKNWLEAGSGNSRYQRVARPLPEVNIISTEVIGYLREDLKRYLKFSTRRLERTTEQDRDILKGILTSQAYNWQFAHAEWEASKYSEREAENIHAEAIDAMANAGPEDALSFLKEVGFESLLKESAKGKAQAKSAAQQVEKKVQWLWKMHGKVIKLASIKQKLEVTATLNIKAYKNDLLGAARYLESRGVMKDVDALEKELQKAASGNRLLGTESLSKDVQSDLKKYINPSFPGLDEKMKANIKGGIGCGLAMLELGAALGKEKRGIRDDISNIKSGIGLGTNLTALPMVEKRIPGLTALSKSVAKYTGPAGDVFDWGCSVQDLYKAADSGNTDDFAYSVVSYTGKGLVAGGSILMLTPLAPLGGALVGIGTAINILGAGAEGVHKGVIDYESVEEKKYLVLMEKKLRKHSPDQKKGNNLKDLEYEVRVQTKVGDTDSFKKLLGQVTRKQATALKSAFADQTLRKFTSNFLSPGFTKGGINWTMYKNA